MKKTLLITLIALAGTFSAYSEEGTELCGSVLTQEAQRCIDAHKAIYSAFVIRCVQLENELVYFARIHESYTGTSIPTAAFVVWSEPSKVSPSGTVKDCHAYPVLICSSSGEVSKIAHDSECVGSVRKQIAEMMNYEVNGIYLLSGKVINFSEYEDSIGVRIKEILSGK